MKKIILSVLAIFAFITANSQELPYSKYINFGKDEFEEYKFKYDDYTNIWSLRRVNGLHTTLNILAIIADAREEVRPAKNDYTILVQMGKDEQVSYVKVFFYNDETYHKLLTFMKDNGKDMIGTSSGKLVKQQAFYGDYAIELNMEQHNISRTSSRTADSRTLKNVDESYNEYEFIIRTNVEPWSEELEKKAARQARRDAKGKKKQRVEDLM